LPLPHVAGATPLSLEEGMSRDGDGRHGGRRGSRSHARDATRSATDATTSHPTDATTSELLPTNAATRRRRSSSSSSSSESGDEGEGYLGTVTFFDRKAKMR